MRDPAFIVFGLLLLMQLGYLGLLRIGWARALRLWAGSTGGGSGSTPSRHSSGSGSTPSRHSSGSAAMPPLHSSGSASAPTAPPTPAISIVVAARDEEQRLPALLDALRAQEYEGFEVVIVDDASIDGTAALVERAAAIDPRFRLVRHPGAQEPRKKRALLAGIAAARHEILAFTDADCTPPPAWIGEVSRVFAASEDPVFMVGIGLPTPHRGLLNALQRWDASLAAWQAAAAIGWGRVYFAKGSNLAYGRDIFESVGGFSGRSMTILNGDDALLLHSVHRAAAARIAWLGAPSTIVTSPSPSTVRGWVRQKIRHTSGSRHFPPWLQVHLACYHGSATLLWLAPVVAGLPGLGLLAARLFTLALASRGPLRHLGSHDLVTRGPALDLLHAVFHAVVPPIGYFRGARRW